MTKTNEPESALLYKKTDAWNGKTNEIMEYAEGYKTFLSESKTERECSSYVVELAKENGFTDLRKKIKNNERLYAGDRVYYRYQNKSAVLFVIGSDDIENGMNITAAHIDSPRLDAKALPLYEDGNIAYMKTHYYGGIKKYQWLALPLSMHAHITTKDGNVLELKVGENESEPVFYITDLLIHLSAEQMSQVMSKAVSAEQLNIVIGSIPAENSEQEQIKLNVLQILNKMYGITESDFISAEIEFVPAEKPRDVGFDKSLISAYGHDDKVCAYPALTALFKQKKLKRTSACILADKEEIGSVGSTGLAAKFFENILAEVCALLKGDYSDLTLRRAFANSYVLSMDVNCCYDPTFGEVFEKRNTATLGNGAILTKYTGSRGKSGSNDAHAEYLYKIKKLFEDNNIPYQTGELGKVDQGGGGTVAYLLAAYGAYTVDFGVGVLSMHAPYELVSKADLYSAYEAANAFYGLND